MKTALLLLVLLAACGKPDSATSADPAALDSESKPDTTAPAVADRYADVEQYLGSDDARYTAWRGIADTLRQSFDDVCGDTFCEGDYSNLAPVRLRCSVDTTSGLLKSCKYVFAGSYEEVNAQTGSIKVTAKTFSCALPVSGIALGDFMSTLTATSTETALRRPLPGRTTSIYDSLVGCL